MYSMFNFKYRYISAANQNENTSTDYEHLTEFGSASTRRVFFRGLSLSLGLLGQIRAVKVGKFGPISIATFQLPQHQRVKGGRVSATIGPEIGHKYVVLC